MIDTRALDAKLADIKTANPKIHAAFLETRALLLELDKQHTALRAELAAKSYLVVSS
jgi:hypothetical protein